MRGELSETNGLRWLPGASCWLSPSVCRVIDRSSCSSGRRVGSSAVGCLALTSPAGLIRLIKINLFTTGKPKIHLQGLMLSQPSR